MSYDSGRLKNIRGREVGFAFYELDISPEERAHLSDEPEVFLRAFLTEEGQEINGILVIPAAEAAPGEVRQPSWWDLVFADPNPEAPVVAHIEFPKDLKSWWVTLHTAIH